MHKIKTGAGPVVFHTTFEIKRKNLDLAIFIQQK